MEQRELVPVMGTELSLPITEEEFEKTACWMAKEYQSAVAGIRASMSEIEKQAKRLHDTFDADNASNYFTLGYEYNGHRTHSYSTDGIFDQMKRRCWRALIVKLGVMQIMSVKDRKQFEEQMERGDLPEISEESITGILLGLAGKAKDFAEQAAREVFEILKPRGSDLKTNNKDDFRVGKKVILSWYVQSGYGNPFRVNYNREQELTAIDGVFHLLDGRGILKEHHGPLYQAINESATGIGQTNYFLFKCFKNGNLHLVMRRLDLVKLLNLKASGDYVLGRDME